MLRRGDESLLRRDGQVVTFAGPRADGALAEEDEGWG
jgi:hypothetical protein